MAKEEQVLPLVVVRASLLGALLRSLMSESSENVGATDGRGLRSLLRSGLVLSGQLFTKAGVERFLSHAFVRDIVYSVLINNHFNDLLSETFADLFARYDERSGPTEELTFGSGLLGNGFGIRRQAPLGPSIQQALSDSQRWGSLADCIAHPESKLDLPEFWKHPFCDAVLEYRGFLRAREEAYVESVAWYFSVYFKNAFVKDALGPNKEQRVEVLLVPLVVQLVLLGIEEGLSSASDKGDVARFVQEMSNTLRGLSATELAVMDAELIIRSYVECQQLIVPDRDRERTALDLTLQISKVLANAAKEEREGRSEHPSPEVCCRVAERVLRNWMRRTRGRDLDVLEQLFEIYSIAASHHIHEHAFEEAGRPLRMARTVMKILAREGVGTGELDQYARRLDRVMSPPVSADEGVQGAVAHQDFELAEALTDSDATRSYVRAAKKCRLTFLQGSRESDLEFDVHEYILLVFAQHTRHADSLATAHEWIRSWEPRIQAHLELIREACDHEDEYGADGGDENVLSVQAMTRMMHASIDGLTLKHRNAPRIVRVIQNCLGEPHYRRRK